MTIQRVVEEAPGIKTFELRFEDSEFRDRYRWRPGQFNMLYVPGLGEVAISISGEDRQRQVIRHTIRRVGSVTSFLDRAEVGTGIGLRGPFGSAWPLDQLSQSTAAKRDVIVVAGGIGLVPLRPLILNLLDQPAWLGSLTLLIGARRPADLLCQSEFHRWRERGAVIKTTVDRAEDGWDGNVGVVTLLLERLAIPQPDSTDVMMCGPDVMMRYVCQGALERGLQPGNLWLSLERHMNCGVGLCGHCQMGPKFLCKDGPVFNYDDVSDWLNVHGF